MNCNNGFNRVMQLASVASMIDLFNADNINIMEQLGCKIDVAANFQEGSIVSKERVIEYKQQLCRRNIDVFDTPIPRSVTKIGQIIKSYKMIRKIAEQNNYKLIHAHSPIGGVVARLAFRKQRKRGTKVIYTAHGFHFFKGAPLLNWLFFYPIERMCSKITDVLITINQEDYQRAKTWNSCQVEFVPGIGVNTEAFKTVIDKETKVNLRREFGFSDNDFVFMSTGQISVRKNHEVIIRALAHVKNENVKYLIVGFGELEEKLHNLVSDLGLDKRVVFAGYRSDVKNLLQAVDAFAFPSLQEGLPVALMEAMAAGLPVVCSRIRGNVDLINDGLGGFIYDCHDVDGFADGISKIANGVDSLNMGILNQETMKKFDKSVVNGYMTSIYKKSLNL